MTKEINEPDAISVSSSSSSVNVDGMWDIISHCSLKQAMLVTCLGFTLMHRGVLVRLGFSVIVCLRLKAIYPMFAQLRPSHVCENPLGNDISDACIDVKVNRFL